jgi:protoporphyrinogen oxidase
MKTEPVHTLILGAGTSGLAAGYALLKAGIKPVILEKDSVPGGLFRSIHRGDFIVDIGRKELYNRIAKVDAFWSKLLGSDYREYAHRGGILFNGHIIDMSPAFRGFRRGMPWGMLVDCGLDFLWSRIKPGKLAPRNVEEYFYQKRGRQLTRVAAQGFQEKLNGTKWADLPLPNDYVNGEDASFFSTVKSLTTRILSKKEVNTYKGIWRHPAKGTGEICEKLAEEILKEGAPIHYKAQVMEMSCVPEDGGRNSKDGNAFSVPGPQSPVIGTQRINMVTARIGSETVCFKPLHVVSSIPPQLLKRFLYANSSEQSSIPSSQSSAGNPPSSVSTAPKRTVVLVYLFLNENPRFPHAWLQVTCPSTRIGRITNYAAFSRDMVPEGKTCLCCEMYCFGPDKLLEMDDLSIAKLALDDCGRSGLLDPEKCFDHLVLRLPGADASQNRDNWMSPSRLKLLAELEQFRNLYYVNRTETDIATLAGLEAAEAILSGDRSHFDRRVDPAELGIRSESKAFEFQLPVAVAD